MQSEDEDDLFGGSSDEEGEVVKQSEVSKETVAVEKVNAADDAEKEKEDDLFIDSDDEQPELVQEYKQQKEYNSDEEDLFRDDEEENDRFVVQQAGAEAATEENVSDFDKVLNKLKSKKRKGDGMTDEEREEFVTSMLVRMDKAYELDLDARRSNKPQVNKLKIMQEVMDALSKQSLQATFLERNLLQVLNQWLKPSIVDGKLPDLTIRNKIYNALFRLPIESDHLRRAGFGKLINYLKDSEKETESNRHLLKKLIQNWSRMIFGKTDNYKMLQQMQSYNGRSHPAQKRKSLPASPAVSSTTKKPKQDILSLSQSKSAAKPEVTSYRAQIPRPKDFQFTRVIHTEANAAAGSHLVSKGSPEHKTRHGTLEKKLKTRKTPAKR